MTEYKRKCYFCKRKTKLNLYYNLDRQKFMCLCEYHEKKEKCLPIETFLHYVPLIQTDHYDGLGYRKLAKKWKLSIWRIEQIIKGKPLVSGDFLNYVSDYWKTKYRTLFEKGEIDEIK